MLSLWIVVIQLSQNNIETIRNVKSASPAAGSVVVSAAGGIKLIYRYLFNSTNNKEWNVSFLMAD